jgi:hypothetical protein
MESEDNHTEYKLIKLPPDKDFDGVKIGYFRTHDGKFGIFVDNNGQKFTTIHEEYDDFISKLSSLTTWTEDSLQNALAGII